MRPADCARPGHSVRSGLVMRVLNSGQMREADRRTIDGGVPSLDLMESAGRAGGRRDGVRRSRTSRRCASRSCAAKATTAATGSSSRGCCSSVTSTVRVWLVGRAADVRNDARTNLDRLRALGVEVAEIDDDGAWTRSRPQILDSDLIVDALFGTGLSTPLAGLLATVVEDVNASGKPVVSIDLPSGLSADRPEPIGPAIRAALTVTLGAPKLPLVLPPADALTGTLVIADIGIPRAMIDDDRRPVDRPAHLGRDARARDAARGRFPQGRLRPRARRRRLAREDRRRASRRDGGAAIRCGTRHGRDAGLLPADRRGAWAPNT